MSNNLQNLQVDFLEWTGGFEPECVEDIETYIAASMPFDIPDETARKAMIRWMEQTASFEIRRNVDQQ
ncbi:MAG: hypothetical protein WC058_06965 [Phycisphaeraceae bacterium]